MNDAAQFPIVDVLDSEDLVTNSVILQVGLLSDCGCVVSGFVMISKNRF